MSEPTKLDPKMTASELLHRAANEIVSAESSLHMYPDPSPGEHGRGFLSDVDGNAAHSLEHMRSAFAHVSEASRKLPGPPNPAKYRNERETLRVYQELRAYMENEWRTDLAVDALDLADGLAEIVEMLLAKVRV